MMADEYAATDPTSNPPSNPSPAFQVKPAAGDNQTGGVDTTAAIQARYQPAINTALEQYNRATQATQAAQNALNAIPTGAQYDDQRTSAQSALKSAQQNLQEASNTYVNAQKSMAEAYQKGRYATTEERNLANARADDALAQGELRRTQADVAAKTAPADIAKANADAQVAEANAALTTTKVQVAQATTPEQIASAQIAVQQATANVEATKTATQRALSLLPSEVTTAQAGARRAGGEADITSAQAAVAPQIAQLTVQQAQTNYDKAQTDLQDAQRRLRQAPTDEQAQQAIQLEIQQKQVALDGAQQQLEQAKQLMPIAVAQGQANVASTQAGTAQTQAGIEKARQGPLYGVQDQIQSYRGLIASGQMTPEAADSALSDWVTKQTTGASVYERALAQDTYAQNARQQDISQANTRFSSGANLASSLFNQFGQLASGAGPGHGDVMARGLMAAMQGSTGYLNQMAPPVAPAPPSAVSQAPIVHINIGSGPPSSGGEAPPPAPPPIMPAAAQPAPVGVAQPPEAAPALPATGDFPASAIYTPPPPPEDQGDQADQGIPEMARGGIVTRPTMALIGERGPEAVVPLGMGRATPQHVMDLWRNEIAAGRVRLPGRT